MDMNSSFESVPSLTDTERRAGQDEIVVIDEDDDDMFVEATVRSIQMAEDEAFARSLQASSIVINYQKRKKNILFTDRCRAITPRSHPPTPTQPL